MPFSPLGCGTIENREAGRDGVSSKMGTSLMNLFFHLLFLIGILYQEFTRI